MTKEFLDLLQCLKWYVHHGDTEAVFEYVNGKTKAEAAIMLAESKYSFMSFKLDEEHEKSLKQKGIPIPTYNMFEDKNSIVFQQSDVISDDLIPNLVFKITVNKECLHRHLIEWAPVFGHFCEGLSYFPEKHLQFCIRDALTREFNKFMADLS
jgi:hypothetical protein